MYERAAYQRYRMGIHNSSLCHILTKTQFHYMQNNGISCTERNVCKFPITLRNVKIRGISRPWDVVRSDLYLTSSPI